MIVKNEAYRAERALRSAAFASEIVVVDANSTDQTAVICRRHTDKVFERPFDWVTVTSASCVDHLMQVLKEAGKPGLFKKLNFVSIGPVTSKAVRDRGGRVAVEAKVSTIEGLVEALERRAK